MRPAVPTSETLAAVLGEYLQRDLRSTHVLSALTAKPPSLPPEVPQSTIARWLSGRTLRPRQWQDLVKIALVLRLTQAETNRLLQVGGQLTVSDLRQRAKTDDDRALLSAFQQPSAPFQAIADLQTFVGRSAQLAELSGHLKVNLQAVICSVRGMGGVGKTALAAHMAYALRDEFPDGVLWARLDVSDGLAILASFAQAFEKDVSQHRDIETRATAVRSLLANKRVLMVLDNAENSAQVKPLLPPSNSHCAVVITTRNDLSAADGWPQIFLGAFDADTDEAQLLFEQFLGQTYVLRYRKTLMQIAELLGGLPLALAITAGHLKASLSDRKSNPAIEGDEIKNLLGQLQQEGTRLRRLHRDDLSVRLSFDVSFTALDKPMQLLFAQLGVFGGKGFSLAAISHVAQRPAPEVQGCLIQLMAQSLVMPSPSGRYRLHPLLRDYAREKLQERDEVDSLYRSINFFAGYVRQNKAYNTALNVEIDNILHALRLAHTHQHHDAYLQTMQDLRPYFEASGLYEQATQFFEEACTVAERLGRDRDLAPLLYSLASIVLRLAKYEQVIQLVEQGLEVARRIDDKPIQVQLLKTISGANYGRGNFDAVLSWNAQGLAIAREIGDPELICSMVINMGAATFEIGNAEEGERLTLEGKQLAMRQGDAINGCVACLNLAEQLTERGQLDQALIYIEEGIALARHIGHKERLSNLMGDLGHVKSLLGQYAEADKYFDEALTLAHETNMPWMVGFILVLHSAHLLRTGRADEAENAATKSLDLAKHIGSDEIVAGALFALAKVRWAKQKHAEARSLAHASLTSYESRQPNRAIKVSQWLEGLPRV